MSNASLGVRSFEFDTTLFEVEEVAPEGPGVVRALTGKAFTLDALT